MEVWRYSAAILGLGTRWREWFALHPGCFTLEEWAPFPHPLDSRLGGPQSRSGRCQIETNILLYRKSNPNRQARSPSLYRLSYRGSCRFNLRLFNCAVSTTEVMIVKFFKGWPFRVPACYARGLVWYVMPFWCQLIRNLCHDSRWHGRDLNLVPPKLHFIF
jgi:hypothetical protein